MFYKYELIFVLDNISDDDLINEFNNESRKQKSILNYLVQKLILERR